MITGISSYRRLIRQAISLFFLVFSTLIVLTAVTPVGHSFVKTALFLPQILPALTIKPQSFVTKAPRREEVYFPVANGDGLADLYIPASGSNHSAVLLFLGVNPAGRDDPRVVGLASALAGSGAVVMIPWSNTMTQRRIAPEEVDNLVSAFEFLRARDDVNPKEVGMGGFCVGASLSAVAAQDVRIRDDVAFVNFFGGYYNAIDLVKSVVNRSRFYGDVTESWVPDHLSYHVVATHLIESLSVPEERQLLETVFLDNEQDMSLDVETLSSEASAVYRLLSLPDFDEFDGLIENLPEDTLDSLRFISPSTNIDDLRARVLIMHDREDRLVPSEESRRLADALGEGSGMYFTEFSLFSHLDPTNPVGPIEFAKELFKLFLHMQNVMMELS